MSVDAVLQPILETVLDAVVVMDREGLIRNWNARAEDTFGWTAAEAVGQNLDIIIPPAFREAHHRGLRRYKDEGVAPVLNQRLELAGLRRDGTEIPVELSITRLSHDDGEVFVGFLRDISERRKTEAALAFQLREGQLMFELSELSNQGGSFEEALGQALDAICEVSDWPVGHAFLVEDDDETLRSGAWSSTAHQVAPELVAGTAAIEFKIGLGLPGQVLEQGKPIWLSRVDDEENFPRRGLGFHSAFAFPVFSGRRCIAILEFFSRETREPEEAMLLSARAIGAQVGRVFERKRSEELRALLLAELDHRAKNILSVVRGMAHLSFGSATDLKEAQDAFDRRLDSIAEANSILRAGSGSSALLGDIVRKAVGGCGAGEDRLTISGPGLCIDSSSAIMVALAIHELCTNAFKYGALSSDGGRITLRWNASPTDPERFDLEWVELGGPSVEHPRRKGFGMRILERGVAAATGGRAEVRYEPDGLRYRLTGARHSGGPGERTKAA